MKIKSLLKDIDIDNVKDKNANDDETTSTLLSNTSVIKRLRNCCKEHLSGNLVPENSYFSNLQILSRGGLIIIPSNLVNTAKFRKLRIWSRLLKRFLMENFIFCAVKLCVHSFRNPGLFS